MNKTITGVAEHHSMSFILYGRDDRTVVNRVIAYNFFDLWVLETYALGEHLRRRQQDNADAVDTADIRKKFDKSGMNRDIVGQKFPDNNKPQYRLWRSPA